MLLLTCSQAASIAGLIDPSINVNVWAYLEVIEIIVSFVIYLMRTSVWRSTFAVTEDSREAAADKALGL